jgi:hypothetical protein
VKTERTTTERMTRQRPTAQPVTTRPVTTDHAQTQQVQQVQHVQTQDATAEHVIHGPHAGPCCLHIGMPKTGTKMLQTCLFARHSQVEFLGTYIGNRRRFRQCRDGTVEELFNELLWERKDAPDFARCRDLFQETVAPALEIGRRPVWSWESLMEGRHEDQRRRAENLKAVFGECRVIVGLRHPVRLVESLYLQLLKRDNVGSRASFRAGVRYMPIERWIEKNWERVGHAPRAHLEYAEAAEIFADVFGAESVGVFLFEQLVEDQPAYIDAICRFAGIDPREGVAHTLHRQENQRWTQVQIDRLRKIHGSLVRSTLFRLAGKPSRRRMLGLSRKGRPLSDAPPARVPIPEDWQQRIMDKTREGNRRLMERWSLPLDRYGYPL